MLEQVPSTPRSQIRTSLASVAERQPLPSWGASSSPASVLGRTRAAVLHAIAEHPACSTKELAAHIGIAPASASEHTTRLREAGLVHTVRSRNMALHSPPPSAPLSSMPRVTSRRPRPEEIAPSSQERTRNVVVFAPDLKP
ncbi:helix-turn-helix domain-containing protein [Nonomuraea sp. NBC_00507]|uniref:ArsR/SmtB family transcription factor n=1 Tax=Nonomuraea sp. NBC_00507 TaxID=2976002 RepID=UPI002E1730DD